MGKARVLQGKKKKKNGDTKRTCHAKLDTIKGKNGKAMTEAEDIKKRWQECTEKNIKKLLNVTDNHDGVTNSPRTRHPVV